MATSDYVIDTDGLTRYFGEKKAVDSVTLRVPRGAVYAFLGRNGSGKTTTIRMLLGFLRPTRGESRVLGEDSMTLSPQTRGRIGYVSENHPGHHGMTVQQEADFASSFHAGWSAKTFSSIIGHFGLDRSAQVRTLSRGQRTGLSLAIALAPQPELLILDDPATGLDPLARRAMLETIAYVTRGSDRTVFFSSHALHEVERVADHVAVLDGSVLRAAAPIVELTEAMRQFWVTFVPGHAPPVLPPIRGLLSVQRHGDVLALIVVRPGADTRAVLSGLSPMSVDEQPVSFADAVAGYLGARGDQPNFLNEAVLSTAGGN